MDVRGFENLRTWWVWRKEAAGFVLAILGLAFLAVVANPLAAVDNVEGKIIEFRKLGRKGSVETYAVIEVNGRQPIVRLDANPECHVGKVVLIQERRTLIATRYSAPRGCY